MRRPGSANLSSRSLTVVAGADIRPDVESDIELDSVCAMALSLSRGGGHSGPTAGVIQGAGCSV